MTVVQVIDLSLVVWPHFIAFLSSFCFACIYIPCNEDISERGENIYSSV